MFRTFTRLIVILTTTLAMLVGSLTPVAAQDAVEAEPEVVAENDLEKLRLRCRGRLAAGGTPGVYCRWSVPTSEDAASVALLRDGGDGWTTIHETEDLEARRHFDTTGEPGVRYRFRVVALDEDGNRVAKSRISRANVPNPQFDFLRLSCVAVDLESPTASCEWSSSDEATSYELWRIVNRDSRELVGTFGPDELAALDDQLGDDTVLVKYAVLGKNDADELVARSKVRRVRFPVAETVDAA